MALLLVVGLGSCSESSTDPGSPKSPDASVSEAKPGEAEDVARHRLDALEVRDRPKGAADYVRDAFGSPWTDIDHNGCNQRDDVLLRDARPGTMTVQRQGRCDHDVLAGTWVDPYTGRTLVFTDLKDLSQAQAIQIDHIVPLAEAWVSGADTWNPERRLAYANALFDLLAVDGPTNASKGASDPAAWRPRKGYQCQYAIRWIAIKQHWSLAVDPSEVRALKEMLGFC